MPLREKVESPQGAGETFADGERMQEIKHSPQPID